jgi:DNA-binding NtrC family response regulator
VSSTRTQGNAHDKIRQDFANRFLADIAYRNVHRSHSGRRRPALMERAWAANIRQLLHEIERAFASSNAIMIGVGDLTEIPRRTSEPAKPVARDDAPLCDLRELAGPKSRTRKFGMRSL